MALTLSEKCSTAIQVALQLNCAISELENAQTLEELHHAIGLIPDQVVLKIFRELRSFSMHDITRAELVKVLQKQLVLRKRSVKRYLGMEQAKKDA